MQDTLLREKFHARCLRFGVVVFDLTDTLPKDTRGKYVADQLMRSGTAVGANLQEAQAAQSRSDFIHKMQLCLKEARESDYWLSVIQQSATYRNTGIEVGKILGECREIAAILAKSIITAKSNRVNPG